MTSKDTNDIGEGGKDPSVLARSKEKITPSKKMKVRG